MKKNQEPVSSYQLPQHGFLTATMGWSLLEGAPLGFGCGSLHLACFGSFYGMAPKVIWFCKSWYTQSPLNVNLSLSLMIHGVASILDVKTDILICLKQKQATESSQDERQADIMESNKKLRLAFISSANHSKLL